MKTCELMLVLSVLCVSGVFGQTQTAATPSLSVTGTAEVHSSPDQAVIRLGVAQESPTAQEAQQKASSVAQAILAGMRQLGIASKDIQTSQLTLYPVYSGEAAEPMRTGRPRIVGYRASNLVSITVTKMDQVGLVVDAGLKAGSNQVEGISFGLQDDTAVRQQALAQAAAQAQEKADTIAKALGLRITGVQEVTEGGVSIVPAMARTEMMLARRDSGTPVSPGEVTVSASLTVKYQIAK
jgi:uncharacterized protein YggE